MQDSTIACTNILHSAEHAVDASAVMVMKKIHSYISLVIRGYMPVAGSFIRVTGKESADFT